MARPKTFDESEALRRALRVFWSKGYNAASMADLVEAMGVNRASLYDTYGDKHALFMAALRLYQRDNGTLDELFQNSRLTPLEKIRAVFDGLVDDAVNDPEQKGCFIANVTTEMLPQDRMVQAFVSGNNCRMEELFANLIAEGQKKGEINSALSPADTAAYLTSLINGIRVMSKINSDRARLESIVVVGLKVLE